MVKQSWIEKVDWVKKGEGIAAQGRVPESAEFFQDHFPDFPVLPGVLMLEIFKQTAERYFQSLGSASLSALRLFEVRNVKFTHFLKPGEEWQSRLELLNPGEDGMECRGKLSSHSRSAASARLLFEFAPEAAASPARGKEGRARDYGQ